MCGFVLLQMRAAVSVAEAIEYPSGLERLPLWLFIKLIWHIRTRNSTTIVI